METPVQNKVLWSDFKLNKQMLMAIEECGFSTPTGIQQKCIPAILGGQHVIGIAQTGTGKTAAYLLPILMKVKYAQGVNGRALVLVPTKELATQVEMQVNQLAKYTDLRVVSLYGGVGPKIQIEKMQAGVDIIISTPGRLLELYDRGELKVKDIKTLVIDEADRIMDMGFKPQLRKIFEIIPSKRQNLLFSATFPEKVERLSEDFLTFPVKIEITPQATPSSQVKQEVYEVPNLKTKINFLEHLMQKSDLSKVILFTRTKESANDVFKFIERKKLGPVKVIHSNKGQNTRINSMSEFRDGKVRVLVATDVAARGIDVANVTHVINFDIPYRHEDYVHRIGRTGRALQRGKAISFVTKADRHHIEKIEKLIREKIKLIKLPKEVELAPTPFEESQAMDREIDRQRRIEDPDFKGSFHEKKRKR